MAFAMRPGTCVFRRELAAAALEVECFHALVEAVAENVLAYFKCDRAFAVCIHAVNSRSPERGKVRVPDIFAGSGVKSGRCDVPGKHLPAVGVSHRKPRSRECQHGYLFVCRSVAHLVHEYLHRRVEHLGDGIFYFIIVHGIDLVHVAGCFFCAHTRLFYHNTINMSI
ncbi:unknown [Eubacterium sp. CAG:786]|nr:unknown [Eubacterium sp. CAG:786]